MLKTESESDDGYSGQSSVAFLPKQLPSADTDRTPIKQECTDFDDDSWDDDDSDDEDAESEDDDSDDTNMVQVKEEHSDIVLVFVKEEKSEPTTPEDDNCQSKGAPPGDSSDGSSSAHNECAASSTKQVG